ncbi:MDIS1-interacting receptor like kinase 2-like protein [Tanacetum coccineum]
MELNLSHNQLSGYIPKAMVDMHALWIIDISYNDLQGPIPESKGFLNATYDVLQGNKDLCGNITSTFTAMFIYFRHRMRKSSANETTEEHHLDFFSVSTFSGRETYDDILMVTKGFNEAFCIRKGRCGSVYKGKLTSNEIVTVKKLHSSLDMVDRNNFLKEVRH